MKSITGTSDCESGPLISSQERALSHSRIARQDSGKNICGAPFQPGISLALNKFFTIARASQLPCYRGYSLVGLTSLSRSAWFTPKITR